MHKLLYPSCRVAFAALVHDIGKFAERAKIDITKETKEKNQHIFCPFNKNDNHFSHTHAAYTGIAIDALEKYLPAIKGGDTSPFQTDETDDSIIRAAAAHHKPGTYLQQIIHIADCLSSAFERSDYEQNVPQGEENYIKARLIPLFERINTEESKSESIRYGDFKYRYPLKPLCPDAIFPALKKELTEEEAIKEYLDLWNDFVEDLKTVHDRENWDLWLDHFDSLYSTYTQNIPSASAFKTVADVSLYDHSKSSAALATALWRYHKETQTETLEALKETNKPKFLLIQGDVSGIQGFIFDVGKHTRKNAYKLLRGRSFLISLFSECAALKVLHELGLPSVSQIMNAAGKFIILAPNTLETVEKLEEIKSELNSWFLSRYYGEVSLGLAGVAASQSDFEKKGFKALQSKIFLSLGKAKLQKFNLCVSNAGVVENFASNFDKTKGVCCFDGRMPATVLVPSETGDETNAKPSYACQSCLDILQLGENLTKRNRIAIASEPIENGWGSDIFGFYVGWNKTENTLRYWDISLPECADKALFNGCARRYINAYVPRTENGSIKTFSDLSEVDCRKENGKIIVKPAVMSIKGDIDDLGFLLQNGIKTPTFATLSGLSRQLNNFFTIWLPWLCRSKKDAANIYTVFAGGDDFYLIGPWLRQIRIVPVLRSKFKEYVCNRDDITFSIGMCMTSSGEEVVTMSTMVEDALENAKKYPSKTEPLKNAVCCFGETVSFDDFNNLMTLEHRLDDLKKEYNLSVGYVYSLQSLCDQADRADKNLMNMSDALWRSKLVYKTVRFVETSRDIDKDKKAAVADEIAKEIGNAVGKYKTAYKIALFTWLYQQREEKDAAKSK